MVNFDKVLLTYCLVNSENNIGTRSNPAECHKIREFIWQKLMKSERKVHTDLFVRAVRFSRHIDSYLELSILTLLAMLLRLKHA